MTDNQKATPDQKERVRESSVTPMKEWIANFGTKNLFYFENGERDEQIINIATLQRINLCRQQELIVDCVKNILKIHYYGYTDSWRENELRSVLGQYGTSYCYAN
jgi:hypothetical protein